MTIFVLSLRDAFGVAHGVWELRESSAVFAWRSGFAFALRRTSGSKAHHPP
jgi:hypothetical protein